MHGTSTSMPRFTYEKYVYLKTFWRHEIVSKKVTREEVRTFMIVLYISPRTVWESMENHAPAWVRTQDLLTGMQTTYQLGYRDP